MLSDLRDMHQTGREISWLYSATRKDLSVMYYNGQDNQSPCNDSVPKIYKKNE